MKAEEPSGTGFSVGRLGAQTPAPHFLPVQPWASPSGARSSLPEARVTLRKLEPRALWVRMQKGAATVEQLRRFFKK